MYRNILVPLDGSKRAEAILPHVEDLAKRYGAKVILLTVVEFEPLLIAPEPVYTGFDPQIRQQRLHEVEDYLSDWQQKLQTKDIETEIVVGDGPVVSEIINYAEQKAADLIAMASHGRTGLARVFYGSVAAGILNRVDRPLLLIRSLDDQ